MSMAQDIPQSMSDGGNVADTLDAAIFAAFPGASERAPGLIELLRAAAALRLRSEKLANGGHELIVSVEGLISAAFVAATQTRKRRSSAVWFTDALAPDIGHVKRFLVRMSQGHADVQAFISRGGKIKPSASVRSSVLPRALELAQQTVARDEYDQRHLLMALLELHESKWPDIGRKVTADELQGARARIVEEIVKSPEPSEKIDAWKAILGERYSDHLPAQRDEPAQEDRLGRRYLAEVLAARIVEVRRDQDARLADRNYREGQDLAFMLHLDGAWGTGKSSVLNLVENNLKGRDPEWLFVRINAWRDHHVQPPWWGVICEFVKQVRGQLRGWRWFRFRAQWLWWQLRTEFAPLAFAAVLVGIGLILLSSEELGERVGSLFGMELTVPGIIGALTALGGMASLGRSIFFGSSTTARAMESLKSDPYGPIMRLFYKLVITAERPILVVIDDIDRCNGDYVVDLLENVQTMLREVPVTYMIAGDRKWITTSFEKRYNDFRAPLDCVARPLGHLFLDKVFQLSVKLPEPSKAEIEKFWTGVLTGDVLQDAEVEQRRADAREHLANDETEADMQRRIEQAEDPALRQALVAEAALRVSSAEFGRKMESRFAKYSTLLDPNPRSIKRLVNRMALNQMMLILAERMVPAGPLARWTAIELRWPLLADELRTRPELIEAEWDPRSPYGELMATQVRDVLGEGHGDALDLQALRRILGRE